MNQPLVFLDIETTGLNSDRDDIIEVAAIKVLDRNITDRFSSLLKTDKKLSPRIASLTGITNEMLADAPGEEEVLESLKDFIGTHTIIGHNVSFDLDFIEKKLGISLDNQVIDTFELLQITKPCAKSYRLDRTPETLGIIVEESHRAMSDTETAAKVFFSCLDIIKNLDREVLTKFYELCNGRNWSFAKVISSDIQKTILSFPEQKTSLPYAYLRIDIDTEEDGLQFNDVVDDDKKDGLHDIDFEKVGELLRQNGPFAVNNNQYSFRQGQFEMLQAFIEGFSNNKHVIVEAGTGTGKSLAYLLPSVRWALDNDTKVVITTHTINLQEQLWNKEIPYLKQVTGWNFKSSLVKGRNNYLCLRHWEEKLSNGSDDSKEVKFILKILNWLTETVTGDKSEINLNSNQHQFWSEICSDNETCLGPSCSWFHKHCFVVKARKKAENAHILIVNHSLLLADIKTDNGVLPLFDYLIIDEAHHLEESATDQLGWTISINTLKTLFLGLNRGFVGSLVPGLFNQLKQVFKNNSETFADDLEKIDDLINETFNIVKDILISIDELNAFLTSWVQNICKDNDEKSYSVRVCEYHRNVSLWDDCRSISDNFISRTMSLAKNLTKIANYFEALDRENQKKFWGYLKEIDAVSVSISEINSNLRLFLSGSGDDVFWIENQKGTKSDLKIRCAPINVSELLYKHLFSSKKSVFLTSATLSVEGDFTHFMERTGLSLFDESHLIKKCLKSPFNYEKQSMLCIVRDLPAPTNELENEYIDHIVPVIKSVASLFDGHTLVLFTSHKMLSETYYKLLPLMDEEGITLLGHKIDGGRTRIVNEFRENKRSVLFGTNSFWEGIDLPGDILKCVIIVRLPFSPPNSPVNEARIEELLNLNHDPFQKYTLPQAVIKFKQGFGRLIRTENDEGVVLVLDRRVVEKRYGRVFLNSLPVNTHFRGDTNGVLQKISEWVDGKRNSISSLNIIDSISDIDKYIKLADKKRK